MVPPTTTLAPEFGVTHQAIARAVARDVDDSAGVLTTARLREIRLLLPLREFDDLFWPVCANAWNGGAGRGEALAGRAAAAV